VIENETNAETILKNNRITTSFDNAPFKA